MKWKYSHSSKYSANEEKAHSSVELMVKACHDVGEVETQGGLGGIEREVWFIYF